MLIRKKTVANYALLWCKTFSLKIWVCKIFDKFHVWSASSLSWQFLPLAWLAATLTGCESATHSHILSTVPCLLLLLLAAGWGPGLFPPPTSLPRSHFHLEFCTLVSSSSSSTPSTSSSPPSSHQMELSAASDKPVPPFSHPLSTYLNSQPDKKSPQSIALPVRNT